MLNSEQRYKQALERIAKLDGHQYYAGVPDGFSGLSPNVQAVLRIDITVDQLAAIAREALNASD